MKTQTLNPVYYDMINKSSLTYNELTAFVFNLNRAPEEEAKFMFEKFNRILELKQGLALDKNHFFRAYKFLLKNHLGRGGKTKKTTPFYTDELAEILANISKIEVVELYNAKTPFKDFYTLVYRASTPQQKRLNGKSFNYFVFNNEIQITTKIQPVWED